MNERRKMNIEHSPIWTDNSLSPCPACGGHPIIVVAKLRLGKGGKIRKYAYAHCQCGDCVVGWHVGDTPQDAVARVKDAWVRKNFISMKKLVEIHR